MTFSLLDDNDAELSSGLLPDADSALPSSELTPAKPPKFLVSNPLDPSKYRKFGDAGAVRRAVFDKSLAAAQATKPVRNNRYELSLHDVGYQGQDTFSLAEQKKALLTGGTVARRMYGTWKLHDLDGNMLSEKRAMLAKIPYYTDRGTFINNGTDYSISNQFRLKPGIYTREKANGEVEAHANVLKGPGHKVFMDPSSGVFRLNLHQSDVPLMPVLRALGATNSELKEAWGEDLFNRNLAKDDPNVISKLYKKLVKKPTPGVSQLDAVKQSFEQMELDPEVSKRTLGSPHTNVNAATVLDTTRKLMRVSKKEEEPDARDAMAYQTVFGPEDVIAERLSRNRSKLNGLLWKAAAKGQLGSHFVNALDDDVRAALLTSRLGLNLESINPAEVLDQQSRVTRMGEGGIGSLDAVPAESRNVHSSQLGFVDILRTAESGSVGVDLRLAQNVIKGPGNVLYAPVRDNEGDMVYKSAAELADGTLAMPGELQSDRQYISAIRDGKLVNVHRAKVDYELPQMDHTFSPMANLVPMKSSVKGQRLVMASRMLQQALPLVGAEAPFVRGGDVDTPETIDLNGVVDRVGSKGSYEEKYSSHLGAVKAKQQGTVLDVTPDGMHVQYADGSKDLIELANNFPYNRKTRLHQTPTLKPGETFQPNQLLATSNYTDKDGVMALGRNLRMAYIPYDGKNWEDAVVLSESGAKKFTSEHMYKHDREWTDSDLRGRSSFIGAFPSKYDKATLANMDDKGVVKQGTVLKPGDPLILAAEARERDKKSLVRGQAQLFVDKSVTWDSDYPGEVTDVIDGDKGTMVVVKANKPMQVGDKLSPRYGDKGILSAIIPDHEMITDEAGKPFDILVSPLGLTSRINPAQLVEAALGKISEKTGKIYRVKDFDEQTDYAQYAVDELRKHGLSATETVIDPRTGRKIPNIATGNRWVMKLHHMAADKLQGRGLGAYDSSGAPAGKTDEADGSKKMGLLDLHAILSSGATQVLREAHMLRGQANPKYWTDFMSGNTPSEPLVPATYKAFVSKLQASGINPVRTGTKTQLMAMTDKDVDELTGDRELQNADTVDWKTMDGLPGGLFDSGLTGGHSASSGGGNRWSHIKLHTPLPNPVMEEPIRQVLGLTKPKFEAILAGKDSLTFAGTSHGTGPQAVQQALAAINLPKMLQQTRDQVKSTKKTQRDSAIRKLGYLKTADELGIHPKDWVLSKVPVLPPAFRPISVMGNKKLPLVDDANLLYKDLFEANKNVAELSKNLSPEDYGDETLTTYKAFRAVTGLGDPVQVKNVERGVEGILKHVLGTGGPKTSMVQRKLLGGTVDFVTRGVIIPNPDLDMDQVGIPEDKAWAMYQPMVVRRLVRQGMNRAEAIKASEGKTATAKKALDAELKDAVVIYNRAPVLHRYGFMAGKPILTKEKVLQFPTFVFKGLGADVDGNCCDFHTLLCLTVPSTLLEAAHPSFQQAWKDLALSSGLTVASLAGLASVSMRVKIGEIPRLGEPTITSRQQEVYTLPDGVEIMSYDPNRGEARLMPVTAITVDRNHACEEVVTARKRKVIVSVNESLCVFDPKLGQVVRKSGRDSVGLLAPYVRQDQITGNKFDFELGWWYGVLIADGWISGRTVGYSKLCPQKRERFEAVARSKFSSDFTVCSYTDLAEDNPSKFSDSAKIHLNSADLASEVLSVVHPDKQLPGAESSRSALYKRIPPDLLHNGSRDSLLGLLSGLLDGDSTLTWNLTHGVKRFACKLNTSSPYLVEDVRLLLRKLGVRSSVIAVPAKNKSNASWSICPGINDLRAIIRELRCVGSDEQTMLTGFAAHCAANPVRENIDTVPISAALALALRRSLVAEQHTHYAACCKAVKSGYLGRYTALAILDNLEATWQHADLPLFKAITSNTEVHWERIVSSTEVANRDVFDLEVPVTKTFALASGLVIWDTMNVQALVTDQAKQDALAKMLPSRNLNSTGNFKVHQLPEKDYVAGLHAASTAREDNLPAMTFAKVVDAVRAHAAGKIGLGRKVRVLEADDQ